MALTVAPQVRYTIVCDEVVKDEQRAGKLMIVGLTTLVNWPPGSTSPLRLDKLTVLLILTDGRGSGMAQIFCVNEETGLLVFGSPPTPISFEDKDPVGHYGVTFKLQNCPFPTQGVYVVQFRFDDAVVHEQFVTVR